MTGTGPTRRRMLGILGIGAAGIVAGGVARRYLDEETSAVAGQPTTSSPPTTARPVLEAPTTTEPSPTTTSTTEPPPPPVEPYQTVDGEVFADAKLTACRVVEALTSYTTAEAVAVVVDRVRQHSVAGLDPGLVADRAAPLFVPDASSTGTIVYPQLGGLDPHRDPVTCSVMVVVDQQFDGTGGRRGWTRCLDVRLRKVDGTWLLEGLADTSRQPVDRPGDLAEVADRALDHPALLLPDSARWDIHEHGVDPRILEELVHLADRTTIGVTCFQRGHPDNVFGTNRLSAHTVGRAVDIWSIGDAPVVQQQPHTDSLVHAVSQQVFDEHRIGNLGAPWAFDGAGGRSFTDPVHHDHLHLGVSA